jgi:hypothetical protein
MDKSDNNNLIIEIDDEGKEYIIDLDVCNAVSDSIFDSLSEQENNIENFDFVATCYSMFITTYQILLGAGWSMDELVKDMQEHLVEYKKSMN